MRRLKQTRLKPYTFVKRVTAKDDEGVVTESFTAPFELMAEIWPATSSKQVEQYGDRISDISNMRLQGQYQIENRNGVPVVCFNSGHEITIGDGVVVHQTSDAPDYRVLSLTEYYPLRLEIERNGY